MKTAAYGTWPSPIDAAKVASAATGYSSLKADVDALYWIESRPSEGGRSTLIRHANGSARELTPAPFNVRSRVHEYGGGTYCVADGLVYFVNFRDQNIHVVDVEANAAPRAITQGDDRERFADLAWDGDALLAVRERHDSEPDKDVEPVNDLVRVGADDGDVLVLHSGHDFYAAPRPSADGRLVFLVWDHPNMPWDGTQLMIADYGEAGLANAAVVAGGADEAIVQPTWCGEKGDRLLFASDAEGYWNLYAYDRSGIYCLLREDAEYAGPAWAFASSYFVAVGPSHVVARRVEDGTPSLVVVDTETGFASPLDDRCAGYAELAAIPNGVAFIAGYADRPRCIVELGLESRQQRVVAAPDDETLPASAIAVPRTIRFPSTTGDAYANFYPPRNADYTGQDGELPPLLVLVHGGPTSGTSAALSLGVQFYTSRGWAVADIDYSGSSGYGRAYRQRLNGAWGVVDVEDCVACVRHLLAEGQADPARVAISGGSAGGYTTLAALAFSNVFKAGASHYGIGDLLALDEDTHKFESRYLHTLVGDADVMRQRSPINHVEQLGCPVIFFQGSEDRIVPPNQAETMRKALLAKGIEVECHVFDGEGHGFRRAENIRHVVAAEYAFFARVFGIGA